MSLKQFQQRIKLKSISSHTYKKTFLRCWLLKVSRTLDLTISYELHSQLLLQKCFDGRLCHTYGKKIMENTTNFHLRLHYQFTINKLEY